MDHPAIEVIDGAFVGAHDFDVASCGLVPHCDPWGALGEASVALCVPSHGGADVGVGLVAGHAELFAVVDEGNAGSEQVHDCGGASGAEVTFEVAHDAGLIVIGEKAAILAGRVEGDDLALRVGDALWVGIACGIEHGVREVELEAGVELIADVCRDFFTASPDFANGEGVGG